MARFFNTIYKQRNNLMANHDIIPPVEFSGEAQIILFTRYGDPREAGWTNRWLNEWSVKDEFSWFPEKMITIHKHFRPMLQEAFKKLEAAGVHNEIHSFDGCYMLRTIGDNDSVLSVHSWGAGIDLNAEDNHIGSAGIWSDTFIKIMESCDIYCGQNWSGRKDPKHFSMVNG